MDIQEGKRPSDQWGGDNIKKTGDSHPLYKAPGFQIFMPEDWGDRVAYLFVSPAAVASVPTVTITCDRESHYASLQEFADKQLGPLEHDPYGYKLIARRELKLQDGSQAIEILFRWEGGSDQKLFQKKIITLCGKTAYDVTAVFTDDSGEGRNPDCEAILASFHPVAVG